MLVQHTLTWGGNVYPQDWSSLSISNVVLILDAKCSLLVSNTDLKPDGHLDTHSAACKSKLHNAPKCLLTSSGSITENREHTLLQALVLL